MRLVACLAAAVITMPAAAAPPVDDLVAAIASNDTAAVTRFVEAYYRDAGISVNDTLTWRTQPFNEIVNWYNEFSVEILLAELPTPEQTAAYWDNWSRVLTAGSWDWQGFFAESDEAYRMAGFNQFLLAAHEYGHALTYRFDRYHEQRGEGEINCREYPADRLAAALLEEVAEADARIAALRSRYAELIAAINAEIDPASRYDVPSFEALNADCRVMHVEQPTDEASMTPYASAFFARHGVLLATDLPPLRELYDTYLLPFWREAQLPPAGRAGAVTTSTTYPPVPPVADAEAFDGHVFNEVAPAMDGSLYVVETGTSRGVWPPRLRLAYGRLGEPLEPVLPAQPLPIGVPPGLDLSFDGARSLGPDQFLLLTNTFGEKDVWLFSARRTDGRWKLAVRQLGRTETFLPALGFDASGNINAFLPERISEENYDLQVRWLRIDPDTLAGTEMGIVPHVADAPLALLADGTPLRFDDATFIVPDGAGKFIAYAGSGLQGSKDSDDPMAAEIAAFNPLVLPDADGGIRFIDADPARDLLVLRRIAPAK